MNKGFGIVWSEVQRAYVVVSELAKAGAQKSSRRARIKKGVAAVVMAMMMPAVWADCIESQDKLIITCKPYEGVFGGIELEGEKETLKVDIEGDFTSQGGGLVIKGREITVNNKGNFTFSAADSGKAGIVIGSQSTSEKYVFKNEADAILEAPGIDTTSLPDYTGVGVVMLNTEGGTSSVENAGEIKSTDSLKTIVYLDGGDVYFTNELNGKLTGDVYIGKNTRVAQIFNYGVIEGTVDMSAVNNDYGLYLIKFFAMPDSRVVGKIIANKGILYLGIENAENSREGLVIDATDTYQDFDYLAVDSDVWLLKGEGKYKNVDLLGGKLILDNEGALGQAPVVSIGSGATVDINGKPQTITKLSVEGTLDLNGGDLTIIGPDSEDGNILDGTLKGGGKLNFQGGKSTSVRPNNDLKADISIGENALVVMTTPLGLGTGKMTIDGQLVLNRENNSDSLFNNIISGNGTIDITAGVSTPLILNGQSSGFVGKTKLISGILSVNGVLGGTLAVNNDSRLQGTGTVGSTTITASGTLAPGNSIGPLTINGDLTLQAGSVFEVEIKGNGQSDSVSVTGNADIQAGSKLSVIAAKGKYTANTRYTILTAEGTLSGQFTNWTKNLPFLQLQLGSDENSIYLDVVSNYSSFDWLTTTTDQANVALAIESLGAGNALYDLVASSPNNASALNAFNMLSGEIYASTQTFLLEDSHHVRDAAINRLRHVTISDALQAGPNAWGQGYGAWGHYNGHDNTARVDYRQSGVLVGSDSHVNDWHVGGVAGYARSKLTIDDRDSEANVNNYHIGVYAGTVIDNGLNIRLGTAYSWHKVETERNPTIEGQTLSNTADYRAHTLQAFGELSYPLVTIAKIEPFVNAAHVRVKSNAFQESGSIAAVSGDNEQHHTTFSTVGARMDRTLNVNNREIALQGNVGWQHIYGTKLPAMDMAFTGSNGFSMRGVGLAKDMAVLGVGVQLKIAKHANVTLNYAGMLGQKVHENSVQGNVMWKF